MSEILAAAAAYDAVTSTCGGAVDMGELGGAREAGEVDVGVVELEPDELDMADELELNSRLGVCWIQNSKGDRRVEQSKLE